MTRLKAFQSKTNTHTQKSRRLQWHTGPLPICGWKERKAALLYCLGDWDMYRYLGQISLSQKLKHSVVLHNATLTVFTESAQSKEPGCESCVCFLAPS